MLLSKPAGTATLGRLELESRFDAFAKGEWIALARAARLRASSPARTETAEDARARKGVQACNKVRLNECSKARQVLTASAIAPGNDETFAQLTDAERRPRELTEPIPQDVMDFVPDRKAHFSFKMFVSCLRSSPRGSAGGPGDTTNEHMKVCLDDEAAAQLLYRAALRFARVEIPHRIANAFLLARMTALVKPSGGIRGIGVVLVSGAW